MNTTPQTIDAALRYFRLGLSVIPTAPNSKKPAVPWKGYQTARADEIQLRRWFGDGSMFGVAVVLGRVSGGTCCRDFDLQASYDRWADEQRALATTLPTVATARGRHVYFRSDNLNFADLGDGEYRGDGHYCLLPPSRHPDGPVYTWIIPPTDEIPLVADVQAAGFLPPASDTEAQNHRTTAITL
jgi:hypothetical protein